MGPPKLTVVLNPAPSMRREARFGGPGCRYRAWWRNLDEVHSAAAGHAD